MDNLPTQKHGALKCWIATFSIAAIIMSASAIVAHLDSVSLTRSDQEQTIAIYRLALTSERLREDTRQNTAALQAVHDRIAPEPVPGPQPSTTFGRE